MLLAAWLAALVAVVAAFTALGAGPFATPALTDGSAWGEWLATTDPLQAVFALGRLAVLGTAWYLLGVTVLAAVARVLRWGRLLQVADLLAVPWVRRLLQSALGLGLATAALTSVPGPSQGGGMAQAVASVPGSATTTMQLVTAPGAEHAALRFVGADGVERAVLRMAEPGADGEQAEPARWQVRAGDHLWGIAEAVLAEAWARAPSDAQVVPYWQALIERNRDALVDPANPDLIYPGQEFELPEPPPAPAPG